jgi:hypothetical protein
MLLPTALSAQQSPPESIRGRWHGTSICVKAEWNTACNDEQVVYDFVPSTQSPAAMSLHASKLVNGAPEPMYDLDFSYDTTSSEWQAEFSNSRVHIRWSYRVQGDSMTGRVVFLPSGRIGRDVRVIRDTAPAP